MFSAAAAAAATAAAAVVTAAATTTTIAVSDSRKVATRRATNKWPQLQWGAGWCTECPRKRKTLHRQEHFRTLHVLRT
jgi:hypothetical protein